MLEVGVLDDSPQQAGTYIIYHMQASREVYSYYYGNKLGAYVNKALFSAPGIKMEV